MHRTTYPGATPQGTFQDGDPSIELLPSEVGARTMTAIQEELCAVVEGAGLVLDPNDNTQVLQAIRLQSAGIRNAIINGGFDLWQRTGGALWSPVSSGEYGPDRWFCYPGTGGVCTVGQKIWLSTPIPTLPLLPRPRAAVVWNQTTGGTSGGGTLSPRIIQRIEGVGTFSGQKIVVSFWLWTESSTTTPLPGCTFRVQQIFGAGGSGTVVRNSNPFTLTDTPTQFSATFDLPSVNGKTLGSTTNYLEFLLLLPQSTVFRILGTNCQIELGTKPSGFEVRPLSLERLLAMRYYEQSAPDGLQPPLYANQQYQGAATSEETGVIGQGINTRFRVEKRTTPSIVWASPETGAGGKIYFGGADRTVTGTLNFSMESTGNPQIGSAQPTSLCAAHWAADAEI